MNFLSKKFLQTTSQTSRSFSTATAILPRLFGIRDKKILSLSQESAENDPLLFKIAQKKPIKVTVTGAAGAIGYSLIFRIANGELLGADQPIELSLLELPIAMNALEGVKMELEDCAFPLLTNDITITDDPNAAFDGCEIGLMVGSKPRTKGMERGDLLKENGVIFKNLGQVINNVSARYARFTVVGNPCNTNCLILANNAPNIPIENFTAMTRLDHDRSVSLLAKKCQLPVNEINYMAIWGNHSATMFVDVSNVKIHGVPYNELLGYQRSDRFVINEFVPKIQQRGARIIEVRGASSAASAGNACLSHTRDWVLGSPSPDWTSMAVCSNGEYGIPPGLFFSYPVWNKFGKYQIVSVPNSFDAYQQYQIEQNIKELQTERDLVSEYLPN